MGRVLVRRALSGTPPLRPGPLGLGPPPLSSINQRGPEADDRGLEAEGQEAECQQSP